MKRKVLIATVAASLLVAAGALASSTPINTYKATYTFNPKRSGTAAKPQRLTFRQVVQVTPGTAGQRAGILLNLRTSIYGLRIDGKDFPTCTIAQITHASSDSVCPRGAAVATGSIRAQVGSSSDPSESGGIDCDPLLHVWNAGQGKLAFFFVPTVSGAHSCANGTIKEGAVPPYPATYRRSGQDLVINVPIPKTVDFPTQGEVGSLQEELLTWTGRTITRHGQQVTSITSVKCKGHTRPYSTSFSAQPLTGGARQPDTESGQAPCTPSN